MASKQTEHYGLSQWEATDTVVRADFNADNETIDAALNALSAAVAAGVKIQSGTYAGSGGYGSGKPCKLTFDFVPKLVFILGFDHNNTSSQRPGVAVLVNGLNQAPVLMSNTSTSGGNAYSATLVVSFSGQTVSYYSEYVYGQMNGSGNTYHYIAFG